MNDISLSIIVPVYNTEKYLKKCIDSIIKAVEVSNKRAEIIVINDGSKGNTNEIMQLYKDVSFIRYIKQENRGRGATRNLGIREAKGKYITFVDSDDYINENMYYDMFLEIDANDRDLVICDVESVDENENNLLLIPGKNNSIDNLRLSCFDVMMVASSVNKIIKRELFDGVKFPEDINYEDLATIPVVCLKAQNIGYINKAYYYYLQNDSYIWWTLSRSRFSMPYDTAFYVSNLGDLNADDFVYDDSDVRPAVSLNTGVKITSGEGTKGNPYIINEG